MSITVITNHHRREPVEAYELTAKERKEFDYYDWAAIERGEDNPQFVRYKGELLDLGEITEEADMIPGNWDRKASDSFFSGHVIRYVQDETYSDWYVIIGRYYT